MKWQSPFLFLVLVAGFVITCANFSAAQPQGKYKSTEELTQMSGVVAHGKVRSMKSEWDESGSRIRTRVTLSVSEYMKGAGGEMMEVFVPGGEVGSVGEVYSHVAKFSNDEEVVVFLSKDARGRYRVSNGSQGKFTITRDEKTGRALVSQRWSMEDFKGRVAAAATLER